MKKRIPLIIFYILEFIFVLLFVIPSVNKVLTSVNILNHFWLFYKSLLEDFAHLIRIDTFLLNISHRLCLFVSLIIINFAIFIIYTLISEIILIFVRKSHKKTLIAHKLDTYELTEEEKARFSWKLYQKNFSFWGLFSFIIPIFIIFFCLTLRFDKNICEIDNYQNGYTLIYTKVFEPFINSLIPSFNTLLKDFITKYITIINNMNDIIKLTWVEYVIIVFLSVLFLLIWFFFVWLFVKINKKHKARSKAKKARKKYISKMERMELRARKSAGERISSKAKGLIDTNNNEPYYDDASIISISNNNNYTPKFSDVRNATYIDDIATGVIDLGIASTGAEDDKEPIEKKIPIFVDDEEVDIVLENEPVIDTIEEEEIDEEDEEEPFFEKYNPDTIDTSYIDDSILNTQVEVYEEDSYAKEDDFITINNYKESENVKIENEEFNNQNNNDIKDSTNDINIEKESNNQNDILEPIEDLNLENNDDIKEISRPKITIKKPLKPIDINKKFNPQDRFKNAKAKYLDVQRKLLEEEKRKKLEQIKHRKLIQRKKRL